MHQYFLLVGGYCNNKDFLKNRKTHNIRKWYLNKDNKTTLSSVGTYLLKNFLPLSFSVVFFVCLFCFAWLCLRKISLSFFSNRDQVVHYLQKSENIFSSGVRKHPRTLQFSQSRQWNFYLAWISWPCLGMC